MSSAHYAADASAGAGTGMEGMSLQELEARINRIHRNLIQRFENLVAGGGGNEVIESPNPAPTQNGSTNPSSSTLTFEHPDPNAVAQAAQRVQIEQAGLVRAVEELLVLGRQLREAWLVGARLGDNLLAGPSAVQRRAAEDALRVAALLEGRVRGLEVVEVGEGEMETEGVDGKKEEGSSLVGV